ncbi:TPA: hypothetical protein ACVU5P_004235 [Vibrio parahaemolyticus]
MQHNRLTRSEKIMTSLGKVGGTPLTAEQYEMLKQTSNNQFEAMLWKGIYMGNNTLESLARMLRFTPERLKSLIEQRPSNPKLYKESNGNFELVLKF